MDMECESLVTEAELTRMEKMKVKVMVTMEKLWKKWVMVS